MQPQPKPQPHPTPTPAQIRGVWPARPALVARLPLQSHFNTGAGRALWLEGRRVSAAPWFNLSAQVGGRAQGQAGGQ